MYPSFVHWKLATVVLVSVTLFPSLTVVTAQTAPASQTQAVKALAFDVNSVRPSQETEGDTNVPLGSGGVYPSNHGVLRAKNFPLLVYIAFAYKLADYQEDALKASAPDWVLHDHYSIEARTEKQDVTKDEMRLMMRTLLAERFKLAVHDETAKCPCLRWRRSRPDR